MGFLLAPEEAQDWIERDPPNREVLFPYLDGEDLNSRPDCSASRWVIDFSGQSEYNAQRFRQPFRRAQELVKPERRQKSKAVKDAPWWLFLRSRPAMRKAIHDLDEVLVITLVSKTVMPMRVPTGQVFGNVLGVFATDS